MYPAVSRLRLFYLFNDIKHPSVISDGWLRAVNVSSASRLKFDFDLRVQRSKISALFWQSDSQTLTCVVVFNRCKNNVVGRQCDRCAPGFYGYPNCRPCDCNEAGTEEDVCDSFTGQCLCKVRRHTHTHTHTHTHLLHSVCSDPPCVLHTSCRRTSRVLDAISAESARSTWTRPTRRAAPAASASEPRTDVAAPTKGALRYVCRFKLPPRCWRMSFQPKLTPTQN